MRADTKIGSSVVTYRSVVGGDARGAVGLTKSVLWVTLVIGAALAVAGIVGLGGDDAFQTVATTAIVGGALVALWSLLFVNAMGREAGKDFSLMLAPNEVTLSIRDPGTAGGAHKEARMRLDEIDHVEWFTPRDRESLRFVATDGRVIEAPLWHMDRTGADAVAFLRARGIDVRQV